MCSTTVCLFFLRSVFPLPIHTAYLTCMLVPSVEGSKEAGCGARGKCHIVDRGTHTGILLSHCKVWIIQRSKKGRESDSNCTMLRVETDSNIDVKKLVPRPRHPLGGPHLQLSSSTTSTTSTTTPHPTSNGVSSTLNWRSARPATLNTTPHTTHHASPPRHPPQAPKTPIHIHTAHHPLGRQLLHSAHDKSAARIQERKGHTECAAVEPQLAETTERRGGRGRTTSGFPCEVWKGLGYGC